MKTKTLDSFQISARVILRPGDRFAISGGPVFQELGISGREEIRVGPRCRKWRLDRILAKGSRVWFEAREDDSSGALGASHVLYVSGRSYRGEVVLNRPYRVRRIKGVKS